VTVPAGFEIGRRRIGPGAPLFVIADIGLNHGGSLDRALALVGAAAEAGASAIKVQTMLGDLVADDCAAPPHVHADSLRAFFAQCELDEPAHHAIALRARALGLAVVATPYSFRAVDLLERINVDAYRIASGDLTYHGLIDYCSRTRKPVVLSTGMATAAEVRESVWSASRAGGRRTALLHSVSAYPVPRGSENLRAIATLAGAFGLPVGLSDHGTAASAVPIAVTLGASLYERHVMLDGDEYAISRGVSSTPAEIAATVQLAAETSAALGHGRKECLAIELDNLAPARRSLRAARCLHAGHVVLPEDIAVLRPGTGLPPEREPDLIGVRLTRRIDEGAPFLTCDLPTLRGHHAAA
jgi:N,N'-diacetyllegionaminate synthase